jgi:hypothetical protein
VAPGETVTATRRTRPPADKTVPVVQIGRIDPRSSEPGLLAELAPEFSLDGGGRAVFQTAGGPSETGWYQSAMTAEQAQSFLGRLVDDIGVLRLAEQWGTQEAVDLGRDDAGNPRGPAALGVIYVHTADGEGRLVLTPDVLASPEPALQRLTALLIALENWKSAVRQPIPPEVVPLVAENLGFWTDVQAPWTPDKVVAWGTEASPPLPRVPVAAWPLDVDPGTLFPGQEGEPADYAVLSAEDAAALLAAQAAAGLDPDYPLWRAAGSQKTYLIGLRVTPDGGNHIWAPYRFGAAAAPTPATEGGTAAANTPVPGSAGGRAPAAPSATAKP